MLRPKAHIVGGLTVLITFVRTLLLYSLVLVVMRVMGKRQIGELQPFELVVTIIIADLVTVPMQDKGLALLNGVIPVITLLFAQVTISFLSLKSQKFQEFICGKPNVLIKEGKVNYEELKNNLYSLRDLIEQLRGQGYFNLHDVEYAILETDGSLSVMAKSSKRPVTLEDLDLSTGSQGISYDLILDGIIQQSALTQAGLDEEWLLRELKKFGINDLKQVIIATLDAQGRLLYQAKELKYHNHQR